MGNVLYIVYPKRWSEGSSCSPLLPGLSDHPPLKSPDEMADTTATCVKPLRHLVCLPTPVLWYNLHKAPGWRWVLHLDSVVQRQGSGPGQTLISPRLSRWSLSWRHDVVYLAVLFLLACGAQQSRMGQDPARVSRGRRSSKRNTESRGGPCNLASVPGFVMRRFAKHLAVQGAMCSAQGGSLPEIDVPFRPARPGCHGRFMGLRLAEIHVRIPRRAVKKAFFLSCFFPFSETGDIHHRRRWSGPDRGKGARQCQARRQGQR